MVASACPPPPPPCPACPAAHLQGGWVCEVEHQLADGLQHEEGGGGPRRRGGPGAAQPSGQPARRLGHQRGAARRQRQLAGQQGGGGRAEGGPQNLRCGGAGCRVGGAREARGERGSAAWRWWPLCRLRAHAELQPPLMRAGALQARLRRLQLVVGCNRQGAARLAAASATGPRAAPASPEPLPPRQRTCGTPARPASPSNFCHVPHICCRRLPPSSRPLSLRPVRMACAKARAGAASMRTKEAQTVVVSLMGPSSLPSSSQPCGTSGACGCQRTQRSAAGPLGGAHLEAHQRSQCGVHQARHVSRGTYLRQHRERRGDAQGLRRGAGGGGGHQARGSRVEVCRCPAARFAVGASPPAC